MVDDSTETDRELEAMEQYVELLLEEIKALKAQNAILHDKLVRAHETIRNHEQAYRCSP